MPYKPLDYGRVSDPFLRDVFGRADLLLRDVYGMFDLPPPSLPDAGGGNWAIALVLVWLQLMESRVMCFRRRQWYGNKRSGSNICCGRNFTGVVQRRAGTTAIKLLLSSTQSFAIHWFMNSPSTNPAKTRPREYYESAVGKWGFVTVQDISAIDGLTTWNEDWPTLGVEDHNGGKRLKLSSAALYWTVKQMINNLAGDDAAVITALLRNRISTAPLSVSRLCKFIRT